MSPEIPKKAEKEAVEMETEIMEALPQAEAMETLSAHEAVTSLTEEYAKGAEISPDSRKVLDGLLAKDAEEAYEAFALEWFDKNQEKIKEKGVVIPPDPSEKWKINIVLSATEKGGMGATSEIGKDEYKEMRGDIDKVGILRAGLSEKQLSPETPFLLLNYLEKSLGEEKERLGELREKAGDVSAGIEADAKEAELESLFLARKEVAEKTMNENFTEMAEKKGFEPKDKYIERRIDKTKEELQEAKTKELIDKEWQAYNNLTPSQRSKYQSRLGVKLELSQKKFAKDGARKGTEEEFQQARREFFRVGILDAAGKNGVKGLAVYGMLEQGVKPHEIKSKGFFAKRMIIGAREIPVAQFSALAKKAGEDFTNKINLQAKEKLESGWDKEHDQSIKEDVEKRISDLAASPETAEGGIEKVYSRAREAMVARYISRYVEKNPKPAEVAEATEQKPVEAVKVVEKELHEEVKEKDIAAAISETIPDKEGVFRNERLRNLRSWGPGRIKNLNFGAIKNYLSEDLGMKVDIETVQEIATEEKYNAALKGKKIFELCLEIMAAQAEKKANKIRESEKKSKKETGKKRAAKKAVKKTVKLNKKKRTRAA